MEDHSSHGSHVPTEGYGSSGHATLGGLSVDADGLRLVPTDTRFSSGDSSDWSFQIVASNGDVVTGFDEAHGQRSHLIVVRRDLTRFQHLHPRLDADGTWRVEGFSLYDPGVYRAFVDLVVDGRPTTLGFDLFASGEMEVAPRPDTLRRATADGYVVELRTDEVLAGESVELVFEISRDGESVSRLDPYLGALGHLVVLREGDLAYLHVHPEETSPDSGRVEFGTRFPAPGRYRLFLQSKPDGTLVTTQHDIRIER
ncbi:FixH family protein [Halorarius litoreus]|uniref:FixH family protein n=1 Tax=Halorarius litoreus TaxID=2962676 RepID=UPI0020CEBBDB|nr:FixH family protein [Halorarius litoreus]